MMESNVRVRFAPSPTGHLHIGNARTAILNWIFAKQKKGQFVLRIEDTDTERSIEVSENTIYQDLQWLGINWDEGPDKGGEFGPYKQSQRLDIYRKVFDRLKSDNRVYPCFLDEQELEKIRTEAIARGEAPYLKKNLEHQPSEIERFQDEGRKPMWLFEVGSGKISWNDLVKGEISMEGEHIGDFVVMRSNGFPTYNFAAAVDDSLMKITHVIRGDDHTSNTPKQILVHEAIADNSPAFAHIPMILGADRTRLSKRHGATSLQEFGDEGYLPSALINFLSLLSWSSETGEEILSPEQLVQEFSFDRMSKSAAIFDMVKLNWMNGQYLRDLSEHEFTAFGLQFLRRKGLEFDESKLKALLPVHQKSIEKFSELPELIEPYFSDAVQPTDAAAIEVSTRDLSQKVYWAFLRNLNSYDRLDSVSFREIMKRVQKETGLMGKDLWIPIRVALTGKIHGPDLPKIAEILGKEKAMMFINNLVD